MDPTIAELPLFPLGTVLFQGGSLPLQIFEPRYLDMVSRCMKEDEPFGVVLIRQGSDTWKRGTGGPDLFDIGTEARIVDFVDAGLGHESVPVYRMPDRRPPASMITLIMMKPVMMRRIPAPIP